MLRRIWNLTFGVFMTIKDMLGRSGVISREEALKTLEAHFRVPPPAAEKIHISRSLGRVIAEEILSPEELPEFDRSTMDGYAVRSADTFGATESLPALLKVTGDILMGTMPKRGIAKGEAMKIATGGALPSGADAVVMFEQTQPVDAVTIEVVKPVAPLGIDKKARAHLLAFTLGHPRRAVQEHSLHSDAYGFPVIGHLLSEGPVTSLIGVELPSLKSLGESRLRKQFSGACRIIGIRR